VTVILEPNLAAGRFFSSVLLAQEGQELFLLGDDFMPWMVLAFGAALVAGNVMALVRPPRPPAGTDPSVDLTDGRERPPLARTVIMIVIGGLASAWGLASLIAS
jgi:hypothetical protein